MELVHYDILSAKWLLMAWCFSTMATVASVLIMHLCISSLLWVNTLRPRQNGRLFADDTFKHIFLNENMRISTKISLKFVRKSPINNIPALVQIMAWPWSGSKPLSEPMLVSQLTLMCVTRPQWVKVPVHWYISTYQKILISLDCPINWPESKLYFLNT